MSTAERGAPSTPTTLTIHGLRLAGLAKPSDVAAIHGLDSPVVERELRWLRNEGLVAPARGDANRWALTAEGRRHGEALLARELAGTEQVGGPAAVIDAYHRFVALNQPMLSVCTRWQIVSDDPVVLNDHSDPARDASIIADLHEIDDRVQPICDQLEAVLARFGRYAQGFDEALHRLGRGEIDWLTKPTLLSYHTLWFQLHEDLLATLGLERAAESARLNGKSTPSTSEPDTFESSPGLPPQRPTAVAPTGPTAQTDSPKDS